MFNGEELTFYRNGRPVFKGLGFQLDPGDKLLLRGANGSGKTTLLQVMAGLMRPQVGDVRWDGQSIYENVKAFQGRASYLGHRNGVQWGLTVYQNMKYWQALIGMPKNYDHKWRALKAVGLAELANFPAHVLSSGQQRRLAIARLLISPAKLWLLDEPTVGLDDASRQRFAGLLDAHLAGGGMAVIATHDDHIVGDRLNMELFHNA